jgi:hypothetical protein
VSRAVRETGAVLLKESFDGAFTPGHHWIHSDAACLTAGGPFTPRRSIPACGGSGEADYPGQGALELTPPANWDLGLAEWHRAVPTALGLDVRFTLYAFGGSLPGADGVLLFFSDGSKEPPRKPSADGGNLGYIGTRPRLMRHAYLGVGFDEYGNFSKALPGGPGFIPETVALGGAAALGHHYLGGVVDGAGKPASLPFDLDRSDQTGLIKGRGNGITIDVVLAPSGLVEVALDRHDGQGFVTYLSESIVGVAGQPPVPATVFVGFIGSTGGLHDRHEITDLTISTLLSHAL